MGKSGFKRLLSAFLCVCMVAMMAPMAFAAEGDAETTGGSSAGSLTIDLDTFIKNVTAAKYDYDGNGITVKWSPVSGCFELANGGSNHGLGDNCPGVAATGNTPKRVNSDYAQFQLFSGVSANVTIRNVNFEYTPAKFKVCENSDWKGEETRNLPAELQFENVGNLTFDNCKFDTVALSAFGTTGVDVVKNCTFSNIGDLGKYAIHYLKGSEVYVSGSTFEKVKYGILLQAPQGQKAYFANNDFSGVYDDRMIKVYQTNADTQIVVFNNTDTKNRGTLLNLDQTDLTNIHCGNDDSVVCSGQGASTEVQKDVRRVTVADNGVISVMIGDPVAAIGDEEYSSLAEAVNAAQNGDTVKLLKNVSYGTTLELYKSITLDLGDYIIERTGTGNAARAIYINDGADVTIKANKLGGVKAATIALQVQDGGKLTVQGGTYNGAYAVAAFSSATKKTETILNDGVFNGCIYTNGTGHDDHMTINGGTYNKQIYWAAGDKSTYEINNGTFLSNETPLEIDAGTLNINGGTFKANVDTSTNIEKPATNNNGSGAYLGIVVICKPDGSDNAGHYDGDAVVNIKGGSFENTFAGGETIVVADFGKDEKNAGDAKVTISGDVKVKGDVKVYQPEASKSAKLSISGGLFSTEFDKSYCATGLTVVGNTDEATKGTYPYTVGTLPVSTDNKIGDSTETGDSKGAAGEKITGTENIAAAEKIGGSVKPEELKDNTVITDADKAQALTELEKRQVITLNDGKIPEGTTVSVVKKNYLNVVVEELNVNNSDIKDNTVTMTIMPKYDLIAVATTSSGKTEVTLKSAQDTTVTAATKVTVTLPASFKSQKVYITHKNDIYVANADENGTIEFTTNGFSPFTFALTNPGVVAEIGGNDAYTSFGNAVNAVANGGTIDIVGGTSPYTATANKTYTVRNKTGAEITVNGQKIANDASYTFKYTPSSSSGSSSGSGSSTYKVTTSAVNNGGVNASPSNAAKGKTVTITLSPDKGYKLDKLTVTDGSGKTVSTTKKSDTVYTFTMPASQVKVNVSYVKEDSAVTEPTTGFSDVAASAWYADAVKYAVDKGMMNGVGNGKFAPDGTTSRGMIVTVLYRLEGEPAVSAASFSDVAADAYYTKAVAWASANGIVTGYGNGKFGPNDAITREQFAAILYRYAQYKKYDVSVGENTNILSYNDAQSVSSYAVPAIQWACGAGVMNGSSGYLTPKSGATRAQAAQLLMNFCENVQK